ncbi:MAG: flagellar protein FlgN [Candidatus Coatesbacteria bacterium]|nr:flagellar protein FlgN [Candidatus Coatesbacteria bacterium]
MLPSIYPYFDDLADSLEAETAILQNLADLFTAERELVVGGDVDALTRLTKRKRGLQNELSAAAQNTERAMIALCGEAGIDRNSTTLNRLPGLILTNDAERACMLSRRLEEHRLAANGAGQAGLRTQELLKKSMEYVDHMVRTIAQADKPPSIYAANARLRPGAQESRSSITL